MSKTSKPKRGDRIRVTRTRPDGRVRDRIGVITNNPSEFGFLFQEEEGSHGWLADTPAMESIGWRQVIEPMPEAPA